ncbi:MAG: hypothetical protein UV17_C0059G0003 [Candidatus Gottesmanbacteria bacterium GW2011_GWA1_42_26]|nr:MAG: hypothetical protein UV17_C0059G0003 [Candidatus Gottesmanbacteria bacterium GW2011_GWA1_42_26]
MTKNLSYLIDLTYDKAYKGYLYGCMSQGKTKREALANAKKAIKAYMEAIEKSETNKSIFQEVISIPMSLASA